MGFPIKIKKRIFCPKTTKFGPKLAFLVNLGQAMQAYLVPCCGSVGGCGARAVSRKTPIYFMVDNNISWSSSFTNPLWGCLQHVGEIIKVVSCASYIQLYLFDVNRQIHPKKSSSRFPAFGGNWMQTLICSKQTFKIS